jgi:hypothetical protein
LGLAIPTDKKLDGAVVEDELIDRLVGRGVKVSAENLFGSAGGRLEGLIEAEEEVSVVQNVRVDDPLTEADEEVRVGIPQGIVAQDVQLVCRLVEFCGGTPDPVVDFALVALGEPKSLPRP